MKHEVLPNSCRICLRNCENFRSIYKPLQVGDKPPIEMLKLITGITAEEVVDADEWPKNICKSCELSLNLAFQFRSKALKSQKIIESYYQNPHQRFEDNGDLDSDPFFNENKVSNIMVVEVKGEDISRPIEMKETSTIEDETVNISSEIKVEDLEIPFSDSAKIEYLTDTAFDDEFDAINNSEYEKRLSIFQQQKQEQAFKDTDDDLNLDSETVKKKENIKKLRDELYSTHKLLEIKEPGQKATKKSLKTLNKIKQKRDKQGRKSKYGIEELKHRLIASKQYTLLEMDNKELDIAPSTIKLLAKKTGRPKVNDESGHICDICGNIYAKRGRMMEHRRRHDKELRFACEFCDKRFHIREKLRKHMFSHSGGKPYPCSFCSRTFFYESVKKAHEAVHNGVKPYICEVCQKAFAYSHALKKHKLIHTDIKLYHCEYCDKDFRLQHHMKQHEETKLHQNAVKLWETASDADAL